MMNNCAYCGKGQTIVGNKSYFEIYITENLLVIDSDNRHKEIFINYCPICGQKLLRRKVKL